MWHKDDNGQSLWSSGPSYINLASSHWIIENSAQENPSCSTWESNTLISVSCVVYWSSTSCCFYMMLTLSLSLVHQDFSCIGMVKFERTRINSPNFNLKNGFEDLYIKDFSPNKSPKFARFWNQKIPNCQIFMISSNRKPRIYIYIYI